MPGHFDPSSPAEPGTCPSFLDQLSTAAYSVSVADEDFQPEPVNCNGVERDADGGGHSSLLVLLGGKDGPFVRRKLGCGRQPL